MRTYRTLNGEKIPLGKLSEKEESFLKGILQRAKSRPKWSDFSNYWRREIAKLYNASRRPLVTRPLFKVCQDIASRLGIEQRVFRRHDYRDQLEEIIETRFKSRYEFCKATGIDEAFLSRVLSRKANLSVLKLESALNRVGFHLTIQPKADAATHADF